MECPYCGSELDQIDTYWRGIPGKGKFLGTIYKCPFGAGAEEKPVEEQVAERLRFGEVETCPSAAFAVAGSFYTDRQGNLHDGYPC
jgi:hypothetical protein